MKIFISSDALEWFHGEMEATNGDTIRFYARYGGSSPVHDAFSLGVTKDTPFEPSATVQIEHIMFFVEERDEWYFDGHDLYVEIDSKLNELAYVYKKA
ncbi:HesB/YadR/YfhF family protein [Psychrobacillus sp. FSL H8-0483]|uniref:HesB/YadR/YfhF family protein n=1 Tax=Psychrobacillus sp. FSL H8-0483 TaxID=2921389 RepID=UPI0031599664